MDEKKKGMNIPKTPQHSLEVSSLLSERTKEGIVVFQIGNDKYQVGILEARKFAMNILRAAEAAETDQIIYEMVMEKLDGDMPLFAMMINAVRDTREQIWVKQGDVG